MPVLDRKDIEQQATVPINTDQPTRFGAINETVKDAFVNELTSYLNTQYDKLRLGELPRIDKYSAQGDVTLDPLETAVSIIRAYPDVTEDMPLIAVMATQGKNVKLSISDKNTSIFVPPARVVSSVTTGVFALTDGMTLTFTTAPSGDAGTLKTSTFIFRTYMFANIGAATLSEVIEAMNFQALYAKATTTKVGSDDVLSLTAGGKFGITYPNKITITGGTGATALGFTVAQEGQNYGLGAKAYERYHVAADLTVNLQVFAESENVRTEVSDLLYDFMSYAMNDRKFQFYGRSVFDDSIPDENYQIILKDNEIQFSGETDIARSGDQRDKIYINTITIPVLAIQYSDRIIVGQNNEALDLPLQPDVSINTDLPGMS